MNHYKKLYFTLFGLVADVIEKYQSTKKYEPIVKKLIDIELKTEEMYMDMDIPLEESEIDRYDEEDWESEEEQRKKAPFGAFFIGKNQNMFDIFDMMC